MLSGKDHSEWEVIFQAIGHPAIILDPNHKVLAANNASSRLTGRAAHEIVGKQCYEIFHGEGIAAPPDGCPHGKAASVRSNRNGRDGNGIAWWSFSRFLHSCL